MEEVIIFLVVAFLEVLVFVVFAVVVVVHLFLFVVVFVLLLALLDFFAALPFPGPLLLVPKPVY